MAATAHLELTAQDKTQAAFRSLQKSLSSVTDTLSHVRGKFMAFAAVSGFGVMMKSAIDSGAEIEKLSKMLGVSTESLSQFRHVAEVSHVSFDALTKGWRLMEKNVSLAAEGTGAAKDALKELGISVSELKNLKPEDQFAVLADAMARIENPTDKVRLAMQIFGRAGAELIPIMDGGSKAIQAAREEADKLGLTLNETSSHQLAQAHEAMVRLKSAFAGAANTLAITFAPALAVIAEGLTIILPKAADLTVRAFIRVKEVICLALSTVMLILNKLFDLFGKLPGFLGKPFREAADAAEMFHKKLFKTVMDCEKTLDNLTAQQQAYHQSLTKTGQTLNSLYHPALQAVTAKHKTAYASVKKLTDAEKTYQATLEKGKQLTDELRTPQEIYRDHLKEINQLLQAGAIQHDTYTRAMQKYQTEWMDANGVNNLLSDQKKQVEEQVKTIANIFRNGLFAYLEGGFKGMVKSFQNALSAMAADLATHEISRFLFGAVANTALKSSSGLLGQFLNDGFGKLFGFARFGGFRAEGGSVFPGQSYIVGEKGAEVFVPKQSGTIVSHRELSKNNTPSIVMHIHTPDANSFRLSRGQITAEMGLALERAMHRNT